MDYSKFFFANAGSEDFVTDKELSIRAYKGYMLSRLSKMFKYKNLPETIPKEYLDYYLFMYGACIITKVEDKLYALTGSYGGQPDPYYRPTLYVVANPALRLSKEYKLWDILAGFSDECVFMRNDLFWMGLNPLMSRYATLLAENMITIRVADIMLRVVALLTAPDDKTKAAAEVYLKQITKGELGIIAENRFFDGVKMQSPPSNNGSYLTQFIELNQYLIGQFYTEIGLSAPYNMKREAINESEASLNEDTLAPLIDTMYDCRVADIKRVNELYGTDISVEFDSSWLENRLERKLSLAKMAKEATNGGNSNDNFGNSNFNDGNSNFSGTEDNGVSGTDGQEKEIQSEDGDTSSSATPNDAIANTTTSANESLQDAIETLVEDVVEQIIDNDTDSTSSDSQLTSEEGGVDNDKDDEDDETKNNNSTD